MANDYFDTADYTALSANTKARAAGPNAVYAAIEAGFDKLPSETNVKQGKINYAVDSGAADAYVVTLPHAPGSYADGLEVNVKISADNTGACTINVNALGVKSIKAYEGSDPAAGALPADVVVPLRYDGTNGYFRIVGIAPGAQAVSTGASAYMQTVLDDLTGAAARATLGVTIGTNVQAFGAVLDDLNTLGANAADSEFLVGTGAGALAWESGATARTSLGLAIGTNVQAWDADLDALAALDATVGVLAKTAAATFTRVTLTGTANEVTVANGDGSGTPTFSLPAALTFTGKTVTGGSFASPTITTSPTAAGATWTDLGAVTTIDINAGTIDGVTMATSDITVGAGKTLDVSAGTLTLAANQISGDKIDGGTISDFASTGIDDNAAATTLWLDSSGLLGLGNTPDAFQAANMEAIQFRHAGAVFSYTTAEMNVAQNAYYDGTWKYMNTAVASIALQQSGAFHFKSAVSGTADAAITWVDRVTITATGLCGITGSLNIGDATTAIDGSSVLIITGDAAGAWDAGGQILIRGETDTTEQMRIGFDTTSLIGRINCADRAAHWQPLQFNSGGGPVIIGGGDAPPHATGTDNDVTLILFNGAVPSASVANGVLLYSEDVAASAELKARDEAGNVATLTPHNFSLIPEGPSEEMAWSFFGERGEKAVNVDMLKLARLVEKLTGEKLVYTKG